MLHQFEYFRGSNQRLEFLGDTVLQLIASEYLYKYFPEHHEGHLSVSASCGRNEYRCEVLLAVNVKRTLIWEVRSVW